MKMPRTIVAAVASLTIVGGAITLGTVGASAATTSYSAVDDTYGRASSTGTNYGQDTILWVDNDSPVMWSYLKFNVNNVASGCTVSSATLRMTVSNRTDANSSYGGDVYGVSSNTWTEGGLTWANKPATATTKTASVATSVVADQHVSWNVTPLVKANGLVSVALKTTTWNGVGYYSSEAAANRPALDVAVNCTTSTPTPTTTTPPPTTDTSMPVGDLPHWHQVNKQDWTTDATLGTFAATYPKWAGYDGWYDSSQSTSRPVSQRGVYNSSTTTTVKNGIWDCYVHTENGHPNVCAVTPRLPDGSTNSQTYGRYSVRFRTDSVPEYKIAWLLWPSSNNWKEGEIDFPEGGLNQLIEGTSHNVTGTPSTNAYWFSTGTPVSSGWHTATIEHIPGKIIFTLDGTRAWSTTKTDALPTTPMRWVLQAESWIKSTAPDPSYAGHIQIDWLTWYQYVP